MTNPENALTHITPPANRPACEECPLLCQIRIAAGEEYTKMGAEITALMYANPRTVRQVALDRLRGEDTERQARIAAIEDLMRQQDVSVAQAQESIDAYASDCAGPLRATLESRLGQSVTVTLCGSAMHGVDTDGHSPRGTHIHVQES